MAGRSEILTAVTLQISADDALVRTSQIVYPCSGTLPSQVDLSDSATKTDVGRRTLAGDSVALVYVAGNGRSVSEFARVIGTDLTVYLTKTGIGQQQVVGNVHRLYRRN